jgi:hypothetical protein
LPDLVNDGVPACRPHPIRRPTPASALTFKKIASLKVHGLLRHTITSLPHGGQPPGVVGMCRIDRARRTWPRRYPRQ